MERVKALARLVMMIAAVTFACTWIPQWYTPVDSNKKAYEQLDEHMQSIQKELNENQEYESFMGEEAFYQAMSEEELSGYVDAWLNNAMKDRSYAQEAQDEIKKEIIALYESQKALTKDRVYHHYIRWVRGIALAMILLSLSIIMLIRKKGRIEKMIRKG